MDRPTHGALQLTDYPSDMVRLHCPKCGREGAYRRDRLIAQYGARIGLPDLLRDLADCSRWTTAGDPCGAQYRDLGGF